MYQSGVKIRSKCCESKAPSKQKRPHGGRRPPRLAVRAASKCRQIEQGPFSSHQGCNNRTTKILSDCLQKGLFWNLRIYFLRWLPSSRKVREIKVFTYSDANLTSPFKMQFMEKTTLFFYEFRTFKILLINMIIRPFLLTHFFKNYTTNFDETLHIL